MNTIKVYRKKDAPEGAVLLSEAIEINGLMDLSLRKYFVLKPNEKVVYIYRLPEPSIAKRNNLLPAE
jgi:hypothetical protein